MKYIKLTHEEYNAIIEARKIKHIYEFKSDIATTYALKRAAEKQSGSHRIGKGSQDVVSIRLGSAKDRRAFVNRVAANRVIRNAAEDSVNVQDKKREQNIRKASIGKHVDSSRKSGREEFEKRMPSTTRGMARKIQDEKYGIGKELKRDYGIK